MKKLMVAVLLLAGAVMMPLAAQGQAAVYGTFTVDKMQNLVSDNELYGATVGVFAEGPKVLKVLTLGGDVEGRFVHKSDFNYDTATIGAHVSVPFCWSLRPYAGFNFGFGRIKNLQDQPQPTTDGLIEFKGGLSKKISGHFDVVGEFSDSQFYAFDGEYNPKAFNLGLVYHFDKR